MGRSRYKIFTDIYPHFLTCTTVKWLPLFSTPGVAEILVDSLRFLQNENRLQLYAYVILENHLHLIATSEHLAKEIGDFKSYTARKIIDYFIGKNAKHILALLSHFKLKHKNDRQYQVWQEGSHPEAIQNREMMRQKIDYIHHNPVKRGFVDEDVHWRYSSARNYSGMEGVLEVVKEW